MAKEKKYHLVMNEFEATYLESLIDGCIGTSECDNFTETFQKLLKQLRKKLYKNKTAPAPDNR